MTEKQCKWGRDIKAAFAARPTPLLPKGWLRVFEDHWDCSPAMLYYAPGVRPDHPDRAQHPWCGDATIAVHVGCIEWGRYHTLIEPEDITRMLSVVSTDHAWMVQYEKDHGLNCTHGAEDAEAVDL